MICDSVDHVLMVWVFNVLEGIGYSIANTFLNSHGQHLIGFRFHFVYMQKEVIYFSTASGSLNHT